MSQPGTDSTEVHNDASRGERYVLELKPEPPGPDVFGQTPIGRLRLLLKMCLRKFGLRCTDVRVRGRPGPPALPKLPPVPPPPGGRRTRP